MATKRAPARPHLQVTQPMRPIAPPKPGLVQPPRYAPRTQQSMPRLAPPPARLPERRTAAPRRSKGRPYLWIVAGVLVFFTMTCAAATLGIGLIYAGGVLPGVRSGGVALGGMSEQEAADVLSTGWTLTVLDGQMAWRIDPAMIGLSLDADATAQRAYDYGRANLGGALPGIFGKPDVPPVVNFDPTIALSGLNDLNTKIEQLPVNAGVQFVNGEVQATAPRDGRTLDVQATLTQLMDDTSGILADGMLELVMRPVAPAVTDATPMVEMARQILTSPLDIRVYDPITGDSVYWSAPPETWATWLTAQSDPNSPTGLSLTADPAPVRDYLNGQAANNLDASRYLDTDEGVVNIQQTIANGRTDPYVRVYHHDGQHVVQAGETITSIAWDYGVPYLYIQEANGGLSSVSVGQSITIPSADNFLPYPVVPDKRIVVSISQQRTWVYENGALKWEWLASTGIPDSPTWPGIYQIISHEPNAYAGNWNLWMPNFMGVYQPIPGSGFTNGFHGFPTRGGSQLLWTNSLGTRVTYGCILLSNDNIQLLYNWAEEGVVVEIQA